MTYSSREIGQIIRTYRKQRGMNGTELGVKAGLSQSKISKIETGSYRTLQLMELERIVNILVIPRSISQQILRSVKESEAAPSLLARSYFFNRVLKDEQTSGTIRIYCPTLLPALLQTLEFRKHYLAASMRDIDLSHDLKQLTARQDMLWDKNHMYKFLLTETVLYTSFGSEIMRAQLDRIERMIAVPNIRIGILPLETGAVLADYGPFALYDERLCIQAFATGQTELTKREDIRIHLDLFSRLEEVACFDEQAVKLLQKAAAYFT
jgi:transcriptional regulator with XRE-family HTH domain